MASESYHSRHSFYRSDQDVHEINKGSWTVEEDNILAHHIAIHGVGNWNSVAHFSGLKRSGKSCRLRWVNYLRPDLRRGDITLHEQLLILLLHCRWGNKWSKIAQCIPGRTDNEIKNYWRTRVQKQAKQLKCDINSQQFKKAMREIWIPRLLERIQNASQTSTTIRSKERYSHDKLSYSDISNPNHTQNQIDSYTTGSIEEWINPNLSNKFSGHSSSNNSLDSDDVNPTSSYEYNKWTSENGSGQTSEWNDGSTVMDVQLMEEISYDSIWQWGFID